MKNGVTINEEKLMRKSQLELELPHFLTKAQGCEFVHIKNIESITINEEPLA